ncbi:MAG: glycoside hydrolase family 3 C-terminal domain-containing protein [Candidatus Choladocola sp.]|nr:glycoside hydrolase family 3 C-terminal domain-containing protein [Candidatus Choladocola sp.]
MKKWTRARYMPNLPLEGHERKVTASPEHLELARRAGCEGMVLLKNEDQILPLHPDERIALFGKGVFDYVKGGGGSGDVTVSRVWNLYDGLVERGAGDRIFVPLAQFYRGEVEKQYGAGAEPGLTVEPELPEQLLDEARAFADTAVIVISRFSGEGWDRKSVSYEGQDPYEMAQSKKSSRIFENSDYCLTGREQKMVEAVCRSFDRVVVVLNVGGMVDTCWFAENDRISGVLMAWQAGMEGGLAMADILLGRENPSGKLPDTFADSLDSYPSTEGFHESPDYVEYTEDIYVGYRYFETINQAKEHVNYPFGFGLSYTEFSIDIVCSSISDDRIVLGVQVKNTGKMAGKEVVQVYVEAPEGLLGKPARQLVAFEKTKKLNPGELQILTFVIPAVSFASYDDLGKVAKSAWVLEKGIYSFYVGNSVRDARKIPFVMHLMEDEIVEQLSPKAVPVQLTRRMRSDGTYETMEQGVSGDYMENGLGWSDAPTEGVTPRVRSEERRIAWEKQDGRIMLDDVAEGKYSMEEFLKQLSAENLAELLGGQPNTGVANTYGFGNLPEFGVPNVMTADGPAGLRIEPQCGICTTAWPCATMLASTWNPQLVREVGRAAAAEVRENNISVWLAPAMNIHRSPLCGRNFEYYSEDPLLTGAMAAAMVEGVQSQKVAATVKHFACNNKETNRKNSDSRTSERALREIYLKGFEICVKKSQPWVLMTSYNLINGQRASENRELLEGILRGEWGFEGVITTDWWTKGEHYKEVKAGNDIKMGTGYPERLLQALEKGLLTEEELRSCAQRVLELLLKIE